MLSIFRFIIANDSFPIPIMKSICFFSRVWGLIYEFVGRGKLLNFSNCWNDFNWLIFPSNFLAFAQFHHPCFSFTSILVYLLVLRFCFSICSYLQWIFSYLPPNFVWFFHFLIRLTQWCVSIALVIYQILSKYGWFDLWVQQPLFHANHSFIALKLLIQTHVLVRC